MSGSVLEGLQESLRCLQRVQQASVLSTVDSASCFVALADSHLYLAALEKMVLLSVVEACPSF